MMINIQNYSISIYNSILAYCPSGWRTGRNVCIKTIETESAIDYAGALATCQDENLGGDSIALPMSPYNENLNEELKDEISNGTLTETEFWIGNYNHFLV